MLTRAVLPARCIAGARRVTACHEKMRLPKRWDSSSATDSPTIIPDMVKTVVQNEVGGVTSCSYSKHGKTISAWHDITYKSANAYHCVIEIPKYTTAKMEIDTGEENNPIIQDTKNGLPRFYHGPIYWNYGAMPQTWEDPGASVSDGQDSYLGDNDPLDVVEIGSVIASTGDVVEIVPLGAFSLIDGGELDWKIIAINTHDPLANELKDISDVERLLPGTVSGIREWFRWYKTPDGKGLNAYGHQEQAISRIQAEAVIEETHEAWSNLVAGKIEGGKLWIP